MHAVNTRHFATVEEAARVQRDAKRESKQRWWEARAEELLASGQFGAFPSRGRDEQAPADRTPGTVDPAEVVDARTAAYALYVTALAGAIEADDWETVAQVETCWALLRPILVG